MGLKKQVQKIYSCSGGCALNGLSNGKLLHQTEIKKIYVPPWANDVGGSIGSAVTTIIKNKNSIEFKNKFANDYLGKEFSDEEIMEISKKFKLSLTKSENIYAIASRELLKNKIIIWFQGRLEMGPRALGNIIFSRP